MISNLAYVDPKAVIGNNVTIHPFAYIDKDVVIGDNCEIKPYASVLAGTTMGKNNRVFQGAIVGAEPQDFRFKGEATRLEIGDNNAIREYVVINRATTPEGLTKIGNRNFILKGTRVGHDCIVDDDCVLGIDCDLAGDCHIHSKAILAGRVIVKENCRVGSWALIKSGCRTGKDVPPYILASHNPIQYSGINAYILRKQGLSDEVIENIALAYRQIYSSGTSLENGVLRIKEVVTPGAEIDYILKFIEDSKMGIIATYGEGSF
ncbi:MAG: acyl-ACP--UDP-N-acetylglucosamine O-acyltransferase [Coprobacter sp.]|nr:acyl-ACP--UDP-N-acetylglucosamine O-acyltransferase [Coprobacter sp.]